MATKSHGALRRQGFKLPSLKTVSLRIQAELWEKCGWAAATMGVDRSEFVRITLAHGTRDAKPPILPEFRGVEGTPAQTEQWERAAAHLEVPIDEFARQAMDLAAKRLFQRTGAAATAKEQT